MTRQSDIAAAAGVSIATVSKALSGSREINQATAARILQIAQAMNYARLDRYDRLPNRESHMVGVICPEISSNYYAQLLDSIGGQIARKGYGYTIAISDFDSGKEAELLAIYGRQQVSGIVLISEGDRIQSLIAGVREIRQTPLVLISSNDKADAYDCIQIDDAYGVTLGVDHLISLGHRRIAWIGDSLTQSRLKAYRETLHRHSLPADESLICLAGERFEAGGYQAMQSLLRKNPRPTAIFAAYDDMAIGAIRAISEAGLSVPKDISLVGMDNVFVSPYLCQALTTVSNPIREMALVSISILARKMSDSAFTVVQHVLLKPALIVRETTGAGK